MSAYKVNECVEGKKKQFEVCPKRFLEVSEQTERNVLEWQERRMFSGKHLMGKTNKESERNLTLKLNQQGYF